MKLQTIAVIIATTPLPLYKNTPIVLPIIGHSPLLTTYDSNGHYQYIITVQVKAGSSDPVISKKNLDVVIEPFEDTRSTGSK